MGAKTKYTMLFVISVLGTTGEGQNLTIEERKLVAEEWMKTGRSMYEKAFRISNSVVSPYLGLIGSLFMWVEGIWRRRRNW